MAMGLVALMAPVALIALIAYRHCQHFTTFSTFSTFLTFNIWYLRSASLIPFFIYIPNLKYVDSWIFLFSWSFLINCQTWRHIINLWQNVFRSFLGEKNSFQIAKKNLKFHLANNFSKPTSLSFRLKLFVETSNHKAAIHRNQMFSNVLKLAQLT